LNPGTYHISVRHTDNIAETGTYNLNVECVSTRVITAGATYGGTISPSGTISVPQGADQAFTVRPSGGNAILSVEVDGVSQPGAVGLTTPYTYTFTNVTTSHTITATFDLPVDACVEIDDVPLDARFQAAQANIMFVVDDSGSMDWEFMTPEDNGLFRPLGRIFRYVFDDPGDNLYSDALPRGENRMMWKSQWSGYNKMYYNYKVSYTPWPTHGDADPDNPRSNPIQANPTFNLSETYDTIETAAGGEIIVDNEDAEFSKTPNAVTVIVNDRDTNFAKTASNGGEWKSGTGQEAYNEDIYYTKSEGDYTALWTPNLAAGEYEVYARWTESSNRSTAVPYTINHAGGSNTVNVNQRQNGGKWVYLGTFIFNGVSSENVIISHTVTNRTSDLVCADAVSFVPTGSAWDWSTDTQAYNDHYFYTPSSGNYTATWTPDLPVAGTWEVQARWYANNERSENVTYTINYVDTSGNPQTATSYSTLQIEIETSPCCIYLLFKD